MKTLAIFLVFGILLSQSIYAQKYAALTFDDAPDSSYTEILLDILKKENVKATFFILGYKAKKYPEIIKRINDEGHLIGNHSTAHKNFEEYKDSVALMHDVLYVDSILYEIIGKKTHYVRPPYGTIRPEQKQILQSHGYKIAIWTLSTRDWDVFNTTKDSIVNAVKKHHHNNAIIIMHSKDASGKIENYPFRNNTVEALPKVIRFLKRKNYQLVTLDKIKQ